MISDCFGFVIVFLLVGVCGFWGVCKGILFVV